MVLGDRKKLKLLSSLIVMFFLGGLMGALGFRYVGFLFFLPLAAMLLILVGIPTAADLREAH